MASIKNLNYTRTVNGWKFKLSENEDGSVSYECRGDTYIDDEGDEQVEPSLETAAFRLKNELSAEGFNADIEWSEKGWIGVGVS